MSDLSEVQTANSYVVSKSGFYKFRATTRGNGVTGLHVVQGNSSVYRAFDAGMGAGISGIDKVDVLWWQGDLSQDSDYLRFAAGNPSSEKVEAECPVVMLDNGRLEDGFATFYVTVDETTYGNVGLAAYDANGTILWSWHIWIQPEVKVVSLGAYTVMDRNLGALMRLKELHLKGKISMPAWDCITSGDGKTRSSRLTLHILPILLRSPGSGRTMTGHGKSRTQTP